MNLESFPPLIGVAVAAAAITGVSVPAWRAWFVRRGWVDEPGGRKRHAAPVPLSGGHALVAGIAGALLLAAGLGWIHAEATGSPRPGPIGSWLAGALAMLLLGWWDDVVELRAGPKLAGQVAVTAVTVWLGGRLPIFETHPLVQCVASFVFLMIILNAYNFLDNMNGLCAGLGLATAVAFLFIGLGTGHGRPEIPIIAAALAGACAGFVPWNYPKATVFLGDSGSHVIGYLAALLAMAACESTSRLDPAGGVRTWAPLLVLTVPLLDLIQVMFFRWVRAQPLHIGDANHVSHLLVRRGFSPAVSVAILWLIAAIAGVLAAVASR